MASKDLILERLDAQLREADAKLDVMRAQAEARKAKDEMDEISGLRAAQARARKYVGDLKLQTADNVAAARRDAESAVQDLKTRIDRANERFSAWDDARYRRFNARLDEAEAQLRVWKAQADQKRADDALKLHDALATLEERIASARARSAEAAQRRHQEAQEALERAARRFEEAYDGVARRFER